VQLRAGDRVDHYTLVKPLGAGGQGSVWQVIDPREGGVVRALKLVALEETGRASFDRARREAKILAAAKHPALVACHAFFEDLHAGLVGVVMDLVPGGSLADAVAEGRIDPGRCFAALEHVASALAYVHGAGLAHRDLKPDNVLLAEGFWGNPARPGFVKLVDFGIAAPAGNPRPLTSVGAVVGTIPYMAPELIDPATWGRAGGSARDLFAFGVMAREILFRAHPTGLGPDASMIDYARAYKAAQAGRIAWPPRGLDGAWGTAIGACLALRPEDRPANGEALLAILRSGSTPSVRSPTTAAVLAAVTAPHRVSTAPWAPPPVPRKTGPSWTARLLGGAVMALVFVVSMIAVAAALSATGWFQRISRGLREPDAPSYSPAPTSTAASPGPPLAGTVISPASIAELGACCPTEIAACTGPTRFACPPCVGRRSSLAHGASWALRVEGARYGSEDLVNGRPAAVLTARLGASTQVLPFALIPPGRAAERALRVTTEDLTGGRINFTLTEGATTLADGAGHLDPSKGREVRVSALCAGLLLYLDTPAGTPITLSVYLDP
jgi:serine/threonine-protein kinase